MGDPRPRSKQDEAMAYRAVHLVLTRTSTSRVYAVELSDGGGAAAQ
jgi:hypothetical protein